VIYLLLLLGLFLAWRLYDLKRLRLKRELALEHLVAEKVKELDSIKSRFFANISHEFRTPLTLILGQIERLRATIREGEAAADLDMMQLSVRRLHNLISQRERLKKSYKSRYLLAGAGTANLFSHLVSSDDKFLMKATDFITRNLSDPALSIDRFAEHMAMSHSQLCRKLRVLADSTPSEMIRSLRLQRAAELLVRHTGNISEIAYEVGFNNPSYFSECFRKHFGYPPSEHGGGEGA
jgi:AraC-like DNA-binding protein